MNEPNISIKAVMDSMIPFYRFQKGEAQKIFQEVQSTGTKILLQNDIPSCVLVEPTKYEEMLEALEDYALYFEAEQRSKDTNTQHDSHEDICSHFGITAEDLEKIEVDIE